MGQNWWCSHIGLLSLLQLASQLGHHTRQLLLHLHLLQIMFSWQYLIQQEKRNIPWGNSVPWSTLIASRWWWWWWRWWRWWWWRWWTLVMMGITSAVSSCCIAFSPSVASLARRRTNYHHDRILINQFDQIILYNDKESPFLKYVASVLWREDNFVFGQIWNFRFM